MQTSNIGIVSSSSSSNINEAMNSNPVLALREENAELKQSLLRLRESYQELQEDSNFHQVKVSELSEILSLRGNSDEIAKKLMTKSMEGAELSMEVDRLKNELQQSTSALYSLGQQKQENNHMLLELSGVVKALQSVQVEYDGASATQESSGSTKAASLQNVKRKVETIMEDRRLLVLHCKDLEQKNQDKNEKILALETQFHLLNSMNIIKNDVDGPQEQVTGTQEIFRTTSSVSGFSSKASSMATPGHDQNSNSSSPQMDVDEDVIRSPKKTHDEISCITASTSLSAWEASVSSSSSFHTRPVGTSEEKEEVERLTQQLSESNERYQQFKDVCQRACEKMKHVEEDFSQVQQDYEKAASKRDELRNHLREVIGQYKQLDQDHDVALGDLKAATSKIKGLEQVIEGDKADKARAEQCSMDILEEDGLADDVDKLIAAYIEARSSIVNLEEKVTSVKREAEEAGDRREFSNRKFRDSVAQCKKLQDETTILEARISEAEEQTAAARKESQKHKAEAKHTRRRVTAFMNNKKGGRYKEAKPMVHSLAMHSLSGKSQSNSSSNVNHHNMALEDTCTDKPWNQRYQLHQDMERLMVENEDLKALCEEILNDVGGMAKQ